MQVKESPRKRGRPSTSETQKKGSSKLTSAEKGTTNNDKLDTGKAVVDDNANKKKKKAQGSPKVSSSSKKRKNEKTEFKKVDKSSPRKRKVDTETSDNMGIVCEEAMKSILSAPHKKLRKGKAQKVNSEDLKENVKSPKKGNSVAKKNAEGLQVHSIELVNDEKNSVYVIEDDVDPMNEDKTGDTTENEDDPDVPDGKNSVDSDTDSDNDGNSDKKDPAEEHISVLKVYQLDKSGRPKRFKCEICGKCASAKSDLIKHIRIHTGDRPYKCTVCDASFIQITAFHGHVTIHT
ncbi:hypothetical protein SK128_000244, partial [Halocaridina rubra]